jgi:hypothetical protein
LPIHHGGGFPGIPSAPHVIAFLVHEKTIKGEKNA